MSIFNVTLSEKDLNLLAEILVEKLKKSVIEETTGKVIPSEENIETTENPILQSAVVDFTSATKKIAVIDKNITDLLQKIDIFAYMAEINHNLHKELQTHKDGLKEAFISPLLKAIIREYDRVVKQHKFYTNVPIESQSELYAKLLYEFEVNSLVLLNLLSDYNIEPFMFSTGDAHNIREQKIMNIVETTDITKDNTVAECVMCGFKDIETGRLFRQAEVKIFKIKKINQ